MAWDLCSKDDVIAFHPVTEAELKDEWSKMVEAMIRLHLGQPYLGSAESIASEIHSGDGTKIMRVYKPPIISVSDVSVNDVAITASDYVVFDTHIALKDQTFVDGWMNVSISYMSGATDVPADVRLAAITMVVAIVNYRKRAGADSSIKWSTATQQAGEESPNLDIGLPTHLNEIMKQVLKRRQVRVR